MLGPNGESDGNISSRVNDIGTVRRGMSLGSYGYVRGTGMMSTGLIRHVFSD